MSSVDDIAKYVQKFFKKIFEKGEITLAHYKKFANMILEERDKCQGDGSLESVSRGRF